MFLSVQSQSAQCCIMRALIQCYLRHTLTRLKVVNNSLILLVENHCIINKFDLCNLSEVKANVRRTLFLLDLLCRVFSAMKVQHKSGLFHHGGAHRLVVSPRGGKAINSVSRCGWDTPPAAGKAGGVTLCHTQHALRLRVVKRRPNVQ